MKCMKEFAQKKLTRNPSLETPENYTNPEFKEYFTTHGRRHLKTVDHFHKVGVYLLCHTLAW